jgi:hypothetical protein
MLPSKKEKCHVMPFHFPPFAYPPVYHPHHLIIMVVSKLAEGI